MIRGYATVVTQASFLDYCRRKGVADHRPTCQPTDVRTYGVSALLTPCHEKFGKPDVICTTLRCVDPCLIKTITCLRGCCSQLDFSCLLSCLLSLLPSPSEDRKVSVHYVLREKGRGRGRGRGRESREGLRALRYEFMSL